MPKLLKFLAFDTSTDRMSVAVTDGVRVWQHDGPGGAQASDVYQLVSDIEADQTTEIARMQTLLPQP